MVLGRLMVLLGVGLAGAPSANGGPPYSPYTGTAQNELYNLLFCDEASAFKAQPGQKAAPWQVALFSEPPRIPALTTLANDASHEGRVRYLAYARLRALGQSVPSKRLLGVIVEVPLNGGLDALAAFSEGGVRYINYSGKIAVYEDIDSLRPLVRGLFAASEPMVARMSPSDQPRRPPPTGDGIRVTFLVSDGMHTGGATMDEVRRNSLVAPVVQRATQLLLAVIELASR